MLVKPNVQSRVDDIISQGQILRLGPKRINGTLDSTYHDKCLAWIASVENIVQIICPTSDNSYRELSAKIIDRGMWYADLTSKVGNLTELLLALLVDLQGGLLSSIVNQVRAEDFDNFLDHAEHYYDKELKNESGSIAGVVFEDTIRRISEKNSIAQKGVSLENLINSLVKEGFITPVKAKWARAAAHVRTKATHAQWDEFELEDVRKTIEFTRELILNNLDN